MDYQFSDLVDIEALSATLKSLHEATGIQHGLVDHKNKVISASGWQDACTMFHRSHPCCKARCDESNRHLAEHLAAKDYRGSQCKNGLMEYATAIVVEGRQLATLYFGQIFHEAPDLEYFRQQAQDCGFDEDAYLAAIRKVPVMSRERVDSIMEFYAQLAQMLAKSGLDRLRLLEATDKLRQLTAQREQEFEEARKRIGNNIHEELAQYLTALKLQLSSMLTEVGTDNTGIVQRGERMQSLLDETFAVTRKLVASVRPPVLKEGIGAALDWLAAEFSRNTNIRCRFVESQSSRNIDEDRAVALFRIAEESLGKIARYTDIKNVVISLDQVSDACLLEVKANGREFDTTRLRTDCLDTDSMRERVRAHGGKIMIDCQPEEGATVRVSIPFPARASTQGNSARPRKNLRRPGARTSLTKSS